MLPLPPLITQHQQREYLRKLGFTPEQITRFLTLRAYYRTGRYQQEPEAYRRLHFVRWLYEQGKIKQQEDQPCRTCPLSWWHFPQGQIECQKGHLPSSSPLR